MRSCKGDIMEMPITSRSPVVKNPHWKPVCVREKLPIILQRTAAHQNSANVLRASQMLFISPSAYDGLLVAGPRLTTHRDGCVPTEWPATLLIHFSCFCPTPVARLTPPESSLPLRVGRLSVRFRYSLFTVYISAAVSAASARDKVAYGTPLSS